MLIATCSRKRWDISSSFHRKHGPIASLPEDHQNHSLVCGAVLNFREENGLPPVPGHIIPTIVSVKIGDETVFIEYSLPQDPETPEA